MMPKTGDGDGVGEKLGAPDRSPSRPLRYFLSTRVARLTLAFANHGDRAYPVTPRHRA
jgi:hypothetical protein